MATATPLVGKTLLVLLLRSRAELYIYFLKFQAKMTSFWSLLKKNLKIKRNGAVSFMLEKKYKGRDRVSPFAFPFSLSLSFATFSTSDQIIRAKVAIPHFPVAKGSQFPSAFCCRVSRQPQQPLSGLQRPDSSLQSHYLGKFFNS